ncbi:hypothetical protein [Bacillus toyonensis]|uniref:hypothetical protein n=1 Tax=Bacillus toyonensis TaxID=155322 RepID=UPI000BFAA0E0|nr:hypothetical protein [Bacillus toyonensis]PGC95434.1 hypothetical protein COM39_02255 [Bacillus toyonensis]
MAKFRVTFKQGESSTAIVIEDSVTQRDIEQHVIDNLTRYSTVSFPLRGGATEIIPTERITSVVVNELSITGSFTDLTSIKFHN